MSFFSDERTNELKELFFESAQELLQALNEQGLDLEKRPGDSEVIRGIRRTVHTLKGDSAACGYKDLSELAHQLEDVLTPELASRDSGETAQVVLTAADVFDSMLSAYRANTAAPCGDVLRELVDGLKNKPAAKTEDQFNPSFNWTEYELLVIEQSIDGKPAYNVGLKIDPQCSMRFAALQLIQNVLKEAGTVLVMRPDESTPPEEVSVVEAVIASSQDREWLVRKCQVPAVVSHVSISPHLRKATASDNLQSAEPLGDILSNLTPQTVRDASTAIPQAALAMDDSPQSSAATPVPTATENILRVDAERIDNVLNLVGELIIGKSMLNQAIGEFTKRFPKDPLRARFADMVAYQSQALNELQRSVMKIRMVPVEQVFRRLPRVVRDVAKLRNKTVNLEISGQETDLDKSVLDALAEPLTHLVRNAVDHGIESPADRVSAGKTAEGKLRLDAYHQGNQVIIEVSDDGRGIDPQKVIARAISSGVVTAEEASRMTDAEITELIFEPGLSTAEEVTEISGRGVGLDVVKSVLQRMKGSVSVQSRSGEGTTFQLKVPLTLAIIRALLFHAGSHLYAVPLNAVVEITRASEQEIHRVDGREALRLRDQVLTLVRPGRLLGGVAQSSGKRRRLFVVVVSIAGRKFGLIVDKLVGEEELVIKALDDHLVSTDLVSGASILGDGTVVLILNVTAVIERLGRMKDADRRNGELAAVNVLGAHA